MTHDNNVTNEESISMEMRYCPRCQQNENNCINKSNLGLFSRFDIVKATN